MVSGHGMELRRTTCTTGAPRGGLHRLIATLAACVHAFSGLSAVPAAAADDRSANVLGERQLSGRITGPGGVPLAQADLDINVTDSRGNRIGGLQASDGSFVANPSGAWMCRLPKRERSAEPLTLRKAV